jgi:hypothetical protein
LSPRYYPAEDPTFEETPMTVRRSVLLATVALGIVATTATASSPAAWAQLDKDAAAACATASDLKDAVVHPVSVRFDDTVGLDARLVTGAWKPAHMKGAKTVMLCLYDRKTRRASVQEAAEWRGALAAPAARPATPTPAKPPVKP